MKMQRQPNAATVEKCLFWDTAGFEAESWPCVSQPRPPLLQSSHICTPKTEQQQGRLAVGVFGIH